ncbi:coiled-coil domain-containing protein 125 [Engraulis encrasicolus]|uniref:coiled-coil domain-containing protein 125 n=1 Tax=Engraulis encrasicolus TaxID=184585 RepID=UPI002FD5C99F
MPVSKDQAACATASTSEEDDMTEGDLGDGTKTKPKELNHEMKHQARSRSQGDFQELLSPTSPTVQSPKRHSVGGGAGKENFSFGTSSEVCSTSRQELYGGQLSCKERGLESYEELQRNLQEVTEEVELLRSELEVTHRRLEGKHEALKILQGHAILDKATTHKEVLLQKSEERTKALEKDVNALQWEINFNQVSFKNQEQTWEEKYERVCSENQALSESLEERTKETHTLRTENSALNQRCLELLAMLSAQERSDFQGTQPPTNQARDGSVLELAVYGACQCPSSESEPCQCAKSAAASRKQVLQLKQELKTQRRKMEEAFVMADAFRIAFEQQLRRGSEHVLHLAETDTYKALKKHRGKHKPGSASFGERLKGLLPTMEGTISKDPYETLHMLLDLLSDKEEALAHQRKVSYMLARNTEDLEKRLHTQEEGGGNSLQRDSKTSDNGPVAAAEGDMAGAGDSKGDCGCQHSTENHSSLSPEFDDVQETNHKS